jgi:hypothetical protein
LAWTSPADQFRPSVVPQYFWFSLPAPDRSKCHGAGSPRPARRNLMIQITQSIQEGDAFDTTLTGRNCMVTVEARGTSIKNS